MTKRTRAVGNQKYVFYLRDEQAAMFEPVREYLEGVDGIARSVNDVFNDLIRIFYQNINKSEDV